MMKKIITLVMVVVVSGLLYATSMKDEKIIDLTKKVKQELLDGNGYIDMGKNKAKLDKVVKRYETIDYMMGSFNIYFSDEPSTTGTAIISLNNITQLSDEKYLIPFAMSYRGSGTFWHLGLFDANFKKHKISLLDQIELGDRVQDIVVNKDKTSVSFKKHTISQSMSEKPTYEKQILLVFDKALTKIITPIESNLTYNLKEVFSKYAFYNKNMPMVPPFDNDKFYPLGLSDDGKFAYMTSNISGEAGVVDVEIYIQDLVSDDILWRYKFNSGENPSDDNTFNTFWLNNHKMVLEKMESFGIKMDKSLKFNTNSISYKNDKLNYSIINKKEASEDILYANKLVVTKSTIYLKSEKYGKKVLSEKKYKNLSSILDIQPIGYFRLKNGTQTALICGIIYTGSRDTPHNLKYFITGAKLDFKPKK
jgi:hypothetical protein